MTALHALLESWPAVRQSQSASVSKPIGNYQRLSDRVAEWAEENYRKGRGWQEVLDGSFSMEYEFDPELYADLPAIEWADGEGLVLREIEFNGIWIRAEAEWAECRGSKVFVEYNVVS